MERRNAYLLSSNVNDVVDSVHDGGIVDEDVDPSELLDDLLDDGLAAGLVSDVLRDAKTDSASSLDEPLGLVGIDLLLGKLIK
jgi:hypothetical protein